LDRWQIESTETVLNHSILKVEKSQRRLGGGTAHQYIVLRSPDWVNVVPLTSKGEVVLIRQWRHGIEQPTLEIPGGLVDPGETPAEAAARELAEETGYRPGRLEFLGWVSPNPALFNNRCHTFLALEAEIAGPPQTEETEQIEVITCPASELPRMVRDGEINHSLVVSALAYLWLRPELAGLKPGAGLV
jgi:8-oxo-dGTP pyrophosphatase MutT (NUDIX family)